MAYVFVKSPVTVRHDNSMQQTSLQSFKSCAISSRSNILISTAAACLCLYHGMGLWCRCLLIEPFPESALNEEAGKLLLENYEEYAKHAKLMTSIHAQPPKRSTHTTSVCLSEISQWGVQQLSTICKVFWLMWVCRALAFMVLCFV